MQFIFDLETQHLIGGGRPLESLGLAVACSWDENHGERTWWESQAGDLLAELGYAEQIIGFNVRAFDYRVLAAYGDVSELVDKTFDLMDEIRRQTGKKISLERLADINLGERKTSTGVEAVRHYQAGRLAELEAYCQKDVDLTRRLWEMWEIEGILWLSGSHFVIWPELRKK